MEKEILLILKQNTMKNSVSATETPFLFFYFNFFVAVNSPPNIRRFPMLIHAQETAFANG